MDMKTLDVEPAVTGKQTGPVGGALQHVLPPLPYSYSALEPSIDARTMTLHHDKHHASYVKKLNAALKPYAELHQRSALWLLLNGGSVPQSIRSAVHNNAGGHLNHSLLWRLMSPTGGGRPTGSLATALIQVFGSLEQFKTLFDEAGSKLFGSGWVWLVDTRGNGTGKPALEIVTTSGHDNPMQQGKYPLLVNDVWEHAYYLKYENERPEYLKSWWSVVNWKEVAHRFESPDESTELESEDGFLLVAAK
jgi:Fe-Mn family superoxide dismutase